MNTSIAKAISVILIATTLVVATSNAQGAPPERNASLHSSVTSQVRRSEYCDSRGRPHSLPAHSKRRPRSLWVELSLGSGRPLGLEDMLRRDGQPRGLAGQPSDTNGAAPSRSRDLTVCTRLRYSQQEITRGLLNRWSSRVSLVVAPFSPGLAPKWAPRRSQTFTDQAPPGLPVSDLGSLCCNVVGVACGFSRNTAWVSL